MEKTWMVCREILGTACVSSLLKTLSVGSSCALLSVCFLFYGGILQAQTFPPGFVATEITDNVPSPTAMTISPDGRLFVCSQSGTLRVIRNDSLLSKPALSLTVSSDGERGLLGVVCDPEFVSNQYFYVYYTATTPTIHNRISRFVMSGDTALPASEVVLLDLNDLNATNHNGGAIHFGPDGKLYAGVGENAVGSNAQTLSNLLGKILRMNADGSIPADNPYYDSTSGVNRAIWALGLRNPFTFAFQPGTGRMFINDVGESTWEEINDGVAGSNYGWPVTEGPTSDPRFRGPLYAYGHGGSDSTGCAIAGGAFYNPAVAQFPSSYVGEYFYGDLCSGWIRVFHAADSSSRAFGTGLGSPIGITIADDGSLYYLDRSTNGVVKVEYNNPLPAVLSSFTGQATTAGVASLEWTTSSETNLFGFFVQRRRQQDSVFSDIPGAFLPGHGTTTIPQYYAYDDSSAGTGILSYRLRMVNLNNHETFSDVIQVDIVTSTDEAAPTIFSLLQNYPNPCNPTARIAFSVGSPGRAVLELYDVLGRRVSVLYDGFAEAGRYHTVEFNGVNLAGGVYFYVLRSGTRRELKKLVLLK